MRGELAVVVTALVLALGTALQTARNRPPGRVLLGLSAVLELVVLVMVVVAVVAMVGGRTTGEPVTFVAYLVGVLLVMPLVMGWALVERTRWSNVVLAVGALTVMAMTARLDQIWRATGG